MRCETPRGALDIVSPLVGEHNVMNLLGAVGVGLALDIDAARHRRGAAPGGHRARALRAGRGRTALPRGRGLRAHARRPRARARARARQLVRRRAARPWCSAAAATAIAASARIMGAIAARLCRPRLDYLRQSAHRAPEAIVAEIVAACGRARPPAATWRSPTGRPPSSARWRWARAGDVVVIAGKGHETYQIIGSEVLPFDDRDGGAAALAERAP